MPIFSHQFTPVSAAPAGSSVDLSVREIEDAGLREILQIPGAAVGSWRLLDALLDPSTPHFRFLEPLGHAREVKTAVSGLFGRFVARAYASKFLGLTHFAHVRKPPMRLSGPMRGELRRVRGQSGDMPDWVAWGASAGFAIVEAKGCHDAKGPDAALARAIMQARRAELTVNGHLAPFKRYAIATRWGFTSPKVTNPMLGVHDPPEDGTLSPDEQTNLEAGVARLHMAALLTPLGHDRLAAALTALVRETFVNRRAAAAETAARLLDEAATYRVTGGIGPDDELVGGFVSRAGPLAVEPLSVVDQEVLRRHKLAPTFVGIERHRLKRAIVGDIPDESAKVADIHTRRVGDDGAGSWVIRIEDDDLQLNPARQS